MTAQPIRRIAIIGFGEVGGIFGHDLARQGIEVSVFDILLDSKQHRRQMLSKAHTLGVKATDNLKGCLHNTDLVISAVTATSALDVAKESGSLLCAGQVFLDINSVSPGTKRKVATHIESGSGRKSKSHFVEAAVMAAVPAARLKVPMLLGGPHAADASERLRSIGMNATVLSNQIGVASAVKMCRSVMIKGLEALAVECLFAARQFGAEDAVLESLAATHPGLDWRDRLPDYLISRVAEHGGRRAAEMREVARALSTVGLKPTMALAIAERQESLIREMGNRDVSFEAGKQFSWRSLADALYPRQGRRSKRRATRTT